MPNERNLREGLTKLVGSQRAESIIRELREGKKYSFVEKRAIVDEQPQRPLTQDEIAAIQAYLGVTPGSSQGSGSNS